MAILTGDDFEWIGARISEYDQMLEAFSGRTLGSARVLEIGYGARPDLLTSMISLGYNACGIDIDQPLFGIPKLRDILQLIKTNGWERATKSVVRSIVRDRRSRKNLRIWLERRGGSLAVVRERYLVGDVAERDFREERFDLVISEDVFEHIPTSRLPPTLRAISKIVSDTGLVLIRPTVFTGLIGGHLPEWYGGRLDSRFGPSWSEPWEHLRKRRRHANTYLNELSLNEYRHFFKSEFRIIAEVVMAPGMGREYLDATVELETGLSADELLSNRVLFVLKPKRFVV